MTLSDDEFTVLMLANEGNSMIPIGRWERPIHDLEAQGFMVAHDPVNYGITPKGRQALHAHEEKIDLGIVEAANKVQNVKTQAELAIREAVKQLVIAARCSHLATGETMASAAQACAQLILNEALQQLSE